MIAATAHVRFHESDFPIPNQISSQNCANQEAETRAYFAVYSPTEILAPAILGCQDSWEAETPDGGNLNDQCS